MEETLQFQDLGELVQTIRHVDAVGASGVEPLIPDDGESFAEATEQFREVLDEHYGDNLDRLCGDDEEVIIERLVVPSDDVPYIEYTVVEEVEDDE